MRTRGRLTVPAELRHKLGLNQGDEVILEETARGVLITPAAATDHRARERGVTLADDSLLMGDLADKRRPASPNSRAMARLGDALRARLRAPAPVGVGD